MGQTGEQHIHLGLLLQFRIALIEPHNNKYCYDKGKNQDFYDINELHDDLLFGCEDTTKNSKIIIFTIKNAVIKAIFV